MEGQPSNQDTTKDLTSSAYRFVIAGLILLVNLALGLNLFNASPLFPLIIEDYSISRATAGLMVTLALLIAAGFGLPGSVIIARMGTRRAFMIGWALLSLLVVSAWVPNFATMLVLRVAYGLAIALLFTATAPLLMQWFKPRQILMMNSINSAVFNLGIAVAVVTAAPLSGAVGWPKALSVFGAIGVVGALAWFLLGSPASQARRMVPIVSRRALWEVVSNRTIILLVAADAGAFFQYTALTTWLPSFFNESRGLSLNQAGFITGLLPFIGIFAVLLGGFLPVRPGSKKMIFLASGVMVVLGGPGAFLFSNLGGIYVSVIVLGIGSFLYLPTLMSWPMEMPGMTPEKVAVVWGLIVTVVGFGSFLSPLLVGGLRDVSGSFLPGFIICAAASSVLIGASVLLPGASIRRQD